MTFFTECDKDTESVGAALAAALERDGVRRAFIAMRGEMGVGKTAFTRGFASHFDIGGVKSPTYTVVNEYAGKCRIFHFDMYRITDEDELYSIGFYDYLENGVCVVEWSENIEYALPEEYIKITIEKTDSDDENERRICIEEIAK